MYLIPSTARRQLWQAGAMFLALLLLSSGCGGTRHAAPEAAPGAALTGASTLPTPQQVLHAAAMIDTGLSCPGASFLLLPAVQKVTADGSDALFTPGPGSVGARSLGDAAYACFAFDLSSLSGFAVKPLRIELRLTGDLSDGTSRVFAGLGQPDGSGWEWGELQPDPLEANSWSWGETQQGSGHYGGGMGSGRVSPLLPVVIAVFGDTELRVSSVAVRPDVEPLAAGPVAFRKGWDGTIKGNVSFADSLHVLGDGAGTVFASFYDDSNGQLNFMRLQNRVCIFKTVDCDSDTGLSHDLVRNSDGRLLLPYLEQAADLEGKLKNFGLLRTMAPDNLDALVWSPRSNFETGMDDSGMTIDAGANPSAVWDDTDVVHIVYEDATTGRIRHAWRPPGVMDWLHDYISPEGQLAGRPVALNGPSGMCCVYMADGALYLAQFDAAMGWSQVLLAEDVYNPIDPASAIGFCDGSVRPGDDTLVVAYSAKGGGGGGGCGKVVFQDLHFVAAPRSVVFDNTDGTGGFVRMQLMGDGSVRLAQFNPREYTVYFETGDIPAESFTSLPAVQFDGPDEDCDGIDFWVDPVADAAGSHDAVLVTLSSSASLSGAGGKKEFKGHVTLLK